MNAHIHSRSIFTEVKNFITLIVALALLYGTGGRALAFDIDASTLGITPFYKTFYGELTITPSPSLNESVVTYQGSTGVFDSSWVGKEFVAFRAHRNANAQPPGGAAYLGNIVSCRYATVTSVIDSKNLIVDFKFNGGNAVSPVVTVDGSGYFFKDCGPSLKSAIASINNPASPNYGATAITFSPDVYVFKGLPGCDVNLSNFPLTLKSDTPGSRARFKISTEDYFIASSVSFFLLNQGANDFTTDIEFLPPHYSVPTVQGFGEYIINYSHGVQVARQITVKNSACNSEQVSLAGAPLPEGANFIMPTWVYAAGGGTRNSTDITGLQVFTLENVYWRTRSAAEIKNNNGGGNFMEIVDSSVIEDIDSKKVKYDDVELDFQNDAFWGARNVSIMSSNLCWDMVANQYWYGGGSTSQTEPVLVRVDGYDLYFGNNGDWQHVLGYYPGLTGPANMSYSTKRLFDQIPQVGNTLSLEDKGSGKYFIYGWGIQVGDQVMIGSDLCTITTRSRAFYSISSYYIHGWLVTLDKTLSAGNKSGVVQLSQTAYLIGSTRTGSLVYNRGAFGHLFYNRSEVGYSIRNSYLKGFFRSSAGKAASESGTGAELWQCPIVKEMVNTVHESQGGVSNISEQFDSKVLKQRSDITGVPHRFLMDGGVGFISRRTSDLDEVEVINHPALIYGGASYGSPYLLDPVTDGQGVAAISAVSPALMVAAGGAGSVVDMSNTFLDTQWLVLYGQGTIILDNLDSPVTSGASPSIQINASTQLTVVADNGRGGLRITAGSPTGNSITLTNWTLLPGAYIPTGFGSTWPALAGAITINGIPK